MFLRGTLTVIENQNAHLTGVSRQNPQGVGFLFLLASKMNQEKTQLQIGFHQLCVIYAAETKSKP